MQKFFRRNYYLKIKKAVFSAFFISVFFFCQNSIADEVRVKKQLSALSSSLIKSLPLDKSFSLKSLSPEKSGLPEEFLKKLSSDLEASLLSASNFKMKLANRLSTEVFELDHL